MTNTAKNFLPIPPKFIIHKYPSLHLDDRVIVVRFLLEDEDFLLPRVQTSFGARFNGYLKQFFRGCRP